MTIENVSNGSTVEAQNPGESLKKVKAARRSGGKGARTVPESRPFSATGTETYAVMFVTPWSIASRLFCEVQKIFSYLQYCHSIQDLQEVDPNAEL